MMQRAALQGRCKKKRGYTDTINKALEAETAWWKINVIKEIFKETSDQPERIDTEKHSV